MTECELPSVVEAWFRSAFERLHPQIQLLHRHGGTLNGYVDIRYGTGLGRIIGMILAKRLGLPSPSPANSLEVEIYGDREGLHWNRRFNNGRLFTSLFQPKGSYPNGHWVERSGPIELRLGVDIVNSGWHWRHQGTSFNGIALPKWLMPKTVAFKEFSGGKYLFSVAISLPIVGLLVSYQGSLNCKFNT